MTDRPARHWTDHKCILCGRIRPASECTREVVRDTPIGTITYLACTDEKRCAERWR